MKTTDPRDPLDQQIDALLASRPITPSDDFASRVLQAAQNEPPNSTAKHGKLASILRFTLPAAAAIALAFIVVPLFRQSETTATTHMASTPSPEMPAEATLDDADAQEIFFLEEGLAGLTTQFESDSDLNGDALLQTLDALFLEIES